MDRGFNERRRNRAVARACERREAPRASTREGVGRRSNAEATDEAGEA
ncbi:hypothetical protein DM2_2982 [Halorubrum sp. DM2]|nr:hypothetical protein DM2_2982 [Halorubrum sp. DM2]